MARPFGFGSLLFPLKYRVAIGFKNHRFQTVDIFRPHQGRSPRAALDGGAPCQAGVAQEPAPPPHLPRTAPSGSPLALGVPAQVTAPVLRPTTACSPTFVTARRCLATAASAATPLPPRAHAQRPVLPVTNSGHGLGFRRSPSLHMATLRMLAGPVAQGRTAHAPLAGGPPPRSLKYGAEGPCGF